MVIRKHLWSEHGEANNGKHNGTTYKISQTTLKWKKLWKNEHKTLNKDWADLWTIEDLNIQ